ncbi:MAG: hypothetical protein HUU35_04165, partial [Armatimonadetes bacterium]|nr:hypothetical protein [Armatimonadota bacterium]
VPPLGTGAWALGWKSLTMQLRAPGQAAALLLLATLAMPLLAAAFLRQIHHHALLRQAPLLVVYLAWSTGVGLFRGQQAELKKVDLLKSLPIPAWSLVLAQTAPAVVGWSLAVCGGLGVLAWAAPEVDRQLCLAVGLAVPALMALVSTSNAALAMIFPASTDPAQVALGQTMLLGCSGLVAAPGMVVGAVLWSLDHPPIAVGLATGGVFGLTAVLCLVVAAALYRRFDPTD